MGSNFPLLLLLCAALLSTHRSLPTEGAAVAPETCNASSPSSCSSLITYFAVSNIRLSDIAALFDVPYTALLGPNIFNLSLPRLDRQVIPSAQPFVVPQKCGCAGGHRVVTSTNYTVQPDNTLSIIADSYYAGLVSYMEIATANDIENINLIYPGQEFSIPLPCACFGGSDQGQPALYLSYQVQPANSSLDANVSLDSIAAQYGTTVPRLQDINKLDGTSVQPKSVLFIPRPVCKANFTEGSIDSNLTVVDGTYELTANNCVQCRCRNGTLHCSANPTAAAAALGATCGNLRCAGANLTVGETATSPAAGTCNVTSCVYKGYTSRGAILTELESEDDPTCPAPPPPDPLYDPPTNLAASPLGSPATPTPTTSTPPPPSTTQAPPGAPPPESASHLAATYSLALQSLPLVLLLGLALPQLATLLLDL